MAEDAMAHWKHERNVNLEMNRYIFAPRSRPRPRDAGMLLACAWGGTREHPKDERLLRLTEYELKLDAALRAGMRELLKLQKEAGAFEEAEAEEPEDIPAPIEQNEPNASEVEECAPADDPGLRSFDKLRGGCAAPASCGEVLVDKTNPMPSPVEATQGEKLPDFAPPRTGGRAAPTGHESLVASPPPSPGESQRLV